MKSNSSLKNLKRLISLLSLILLMACGGQKEVKVKDKENIAIDQQISPEAIDSIVAPYKEVYTQEMSRILNQADDDILKGRPESALGNLLTDLSMIVSEDMYNSQDGKSIDFCLLNDGGIRTNLPAGDIPLGKVYEIMPFENQLVVVEISYDSTLALFDHIARRGEPISHASFHSVNGKATSILIRGNAPEEGRTYKVLTSDYLARGGDNMSFFKDPIAFDQVGIKLRDAIIKYFEDEAADGRSINAKIEGRVRFD